MIIDNFHVIGVTIVPLKANAPLGIDSDAVLAGASTFEHFQPVPRRNFQRFQSDGGI